MPQKNILCLTPRYWPARDGTAVHMQALAERFARDGFGVKVITADPLEIEGFINPQSLRIKTSSESYRGVQIERVPVHHWPDHIKTMNRLAALPGEKNKIFFGLPHAWLPGLVRKVENLPEKFDLVLAGVLPYRQFFYAARRLKIKRKIPAIGLPLIHLGEPGRPESSQPYLNKINFSLLMDFDRLLLNTSAEASPLLAGGLKPWQLITAGAGIDPEALAGGDGSRFREKYRLTGPIVFLIATQTHDKGSHHLVEALKLVWQKNPEVSLVLAGEVRPDFEKYLADQSPEILNKIITPGAILDAEKNDLLAAGDILVMPSRADSFGIAYLEAWFYGKPVIGCYAGGVPEVIDDGVNGLLAPFGDAHIISEQIAKLLREPDLAGMMGQSGRKKVLGNFTWEIIYQKILKTVRELTKNHEIHK